MNTKCLIVGIDGADPASLERWIGAGRLPTLARLRERGVTGSIVTPEGLGDDAVWAGFSSAQRLGTHGRYFFLQPEPGSYEPEFILESNRRFEPFWARIGRSGHRIAVLDVPKTFLATGFDGIQIVDWLVHGRLYASPRSWPPEAAERLVARYGRAPDIGCSAAHVAENEAAIRDVIARLEQCVRMKAEASLDLLESGPWSCFITVFKEAHCAGHRYWHLHDSRHPLHDAVLSARLGDPLLPVYEAIDQALEQLVARAGAGAHVVVLAPLAMASNVTANHLLDELLHRFELAAAKSPSTLGSVQRLGRPLEADRRRRDPSQRACNVVPHNESAGAIRFNVRGREPAGRLAPGAELDAFTGRLVADLETLTSPDTGRPIVERVVRLQREHPGEHSDRLPDLLVVWRREAPIRALRSTMAGDVEAEMPALRTGNHIGHGWYLACGPALRTANGRSVELHDFGASVAALLGCPLPRTDGQPTLLVPRSGDENSREVLD